MTRVSRRSSGWRRAPTSSRRSAIRAGSVDRAPGPRELASARRCRLADPPTPTGGWWPRSPIVRPGSRRSRTTRCASAPPICASPPRTPGRSSLSSSTPSRSCARPRAAFSASASTTCRSLGGLALHRGALAEMQTGEGKTLAAVAPVFLTALAGRGSHVLTFNDYLARRDAAWMGPVYERLGLTVGCVQEGMAAGGAARGLRARRHLRHRQGSRLRPPARRPLPRLAEQVHRCRCRGDQRALHAAIVDEADSILIDEARIPLVIAGAGGERGRRAPAAPRRDRAPPRARAPTTTPTSTRATSSSPTAARRGRGSRSAAAACSRPRT